MLLRSAHLRKAATRFFNDDSGNVLAEYAIILAVLSLACIVGFEEVGNAAATGVTTDTTGFTTTGTSPP